MHPTQPKFLDPLALLFLLLTSLLALTLTAFNIHGSSLNMFDQLISHTRTPPLIGSPKEIRIDEWNDFTPAILYQLRRPDRLNYRTSVFGPECAALLSNLPSNHFTTLFRPQFWPFFLLPEKTAFAAWWQFKSWILLTGLFLLFKRFTNSSTLAILGALWFFFSSFTQWWFSSATCMPEMVGLFGFSVTGFTFLLTEKSISRLLVIAVLTAGCTINFILCLYPSYLLPLIFIAVILLAAFFLTNRKQIIERPLLKYRLLALVLTAAIIAAVLIPFFNDIRPALNILAQTTYPGHRVTGGGEVSVPELLHHFTNIFHTEKKPFTPPYNVCESAGFLWLAPIAILVAILLRKKLNTEPLAKRTLIALTIFSALFLAWMLLPRTPILDKILLLSHVSSHRAILALGLANIFVTILALRLLPKTPRKIATVILLALILPLIFANSLINPLDRNFKSIDQSALHHAVSENPNLRQGRWLIFSNRITAAPFFSANGLDVFNTPKFIPDLPALQSLDPASLPIYNQSGYLRVEPLPARSPLKFSAQFFFTIDLAIDPLDPHLQPLNIRYLAFDSPLKSIPKDSLTPLFDHPLDGFWLYELPPRP